MNDVATGFLAFWIVGIWLMPERAVALHYFRLPMALTVVFGSLGTVIHERSTSRFGEGVGRVLLGIGLAIAGAFFAFCFWLIFTAKR